MTTQFATTRPIHSKIKLFLNKFVIVSFEIWDDFKWRSGFLEFIAGTIQWKHIMVNSKGYK